MSSSRPAAVVVPVAELVVEADDGVLLLLAEVAALDVRAQVVDPPEPAALAAPLQPWPIWQEHDAHQDMSKSNNSSHGGSVGQTVPACLGTALQQLWPWAVMYLTSFSSSSGDHSPRFTFCLLQQWCPMAARPTAPLSSSPLPSSFLLSLYPPSSPPRPQQCM